MTIQAKKAHTIRLTYSGYGKFIATWKGYEKNTYYFRFSRLNDLECDLFEKAALEAAQMFAQWLTDTTPTGGLRDCIITSITMGEISADKRVVLVRTDWSEIR